MKVIELKVQTANGTMSKPAPMMEWLLDSELFLMARLLKLSNIGLIDIINSAIHKEISNRIKKQQLEILVKKKVAEEKKLEMKRIKFVSEVQRDINKPSKEREEQK